MPRPQRCRRVCSLPQTEEFGPIGIAQTDNYSTTMSVDEYEVIRLIDLAGLTQGQCAAQMKVARTTVTGIYEKARQKIADSLVNGKRLLIEGGTYQLCAEPNESCGRQCHCCSGTANRINKKEK
jgi:predicted DNA-binding protein (UPF0251 family)